MQRQRRSLKDIVQEDKGIDQINDSGSVADNLEVPSPVAAGVTVSKKTKNTKTAPREENRNIISDKIISKSEFIKMSITIEPELFENVDELSRKRRRSKEPYSYSLIVRDALKEYFEKNK